jgi:regulator of protease activity HflC (stomatin/prohibitin superfamily)
MHAVTTPTPSESPLTPRSGRVALVMHLTIMAMLAALIRATIRNAQEGRPIGVPLTLAILAALLMLLWTFGYFVVNPGDSRAILFFGTYRGTVRSAGFHWVHPFSVKRRVTLRARSLETGAAPTPEVKNPGTGAVITPAGYTRGGPLKVNDRDGNPIEIAAVVVWRVIDTAKALFSVDDYERFVAIQSESALRNLASAYHYDLPDDHETPSLRGNTELVGDKLREELHQRLAVAGVEVDEARISSLAYAPEIAAVMLRRQQAAAVIAARQKIVEGAVGMVEQALQQLESKGLLQTQSVERARMVSNLLVVLCGEQSPQPVVGMG